MNELLLRLQLPLPPTTLADSPVTTLVEPLPMNELLPIALLLKPPTTVDWKP